MKRKNKWMCTMALGVMLFVVGASVAGCGGRYTGVERAVSDSAVSGSAVSGTAVITDAVSEGAIKNTDEDTTDTKKREKNRRKYRFSTDTNVYFADLSEEKYDIDLWYIGQARLDGTHKKIVVKPDPNTSFVWLKYVDDDWLYYEAETQYSIERTILYRVPIEKDAEGYDVVNTAGREELLRDMAFNELFFDFPYVFYCTDEGKIAKYDLRIKKQVSKDWSISQDVEDNGLKFFRVNDSYVMLTEDSGVYVQKIDDTDWKQCGTDYMRVGTKRYRELMAAQTEKNLYYEMYAQGTNLNKGIWRYDGETNECSVTVAQYEQAAVLAKGMGTSAKLDVCKVADIYASEDRLYLQLAVGWMDGKVYRMEHLMFSKGEDEKNLRYEKKLTECMQSHVKTRTGKWATWEEDEEPEKVYLEHVAVNGAQCVYILNGKAYLSLYDFDNDKGRMGCYEFDSGKFHWVTEKEANYGELLCEGAYEEKELYVVFEEDVDDNDYAMVEIIPNRKDDEEEGAFYETGK